MARVMLEPVEGRPAWEVRVEGKRVGLIWRDRRYFRGIEEGREEPLGTKFNSREAAARALARRAGFEDARDVIAEPER
ncbi:MAG: hypothetical protein M3135_08615 [Actinomycetota bacterium]|nr:hypothetical protein [Actinomycetota bacterium]